MPGSSDTGGMGRLAGRTKANTDALLGDAEARLLAATDVDLGALRPKVSDPASFDKLVAAVQESTARNESLAELKQRITDLGDGVLAVAKEVAPLLRI